jgi:hypothetical protein
MIGRNVNKEQAKSLKVGDRVCWSQYPGNIGIVTYVGSNGILIEWAGQVDLAWVDHSHMENFHKMLIIPPRRAKGTKVVF